MEMLRLWFLNAATRNKTDQPEHQEDEEEYLGDLGSGSRYPDETKQPRDQSDYEKYQRPMQHVSGLRRVW